MMGPIEEQEKVLAECESRVGKAHPDLVQVLDELALRYHSEARYEEAEACYKRAIAVIEDARGADDSSLAPLLHHLGVLYRIEKKFADAEAVYQRSLALVKKKDADPLVVATHQNYLAGLYFAWYKYFEAEALVIGSMRIYEETLGPQHEFVAHSLLALALICERQGRMDEANNYFAQCEKLSTRQPRHEFLEPFSHLATALYNLACTYFKQQRFDDAEIVFRYAVLRDIWQLWPAHPKVAESLQMLGDLYQAQSMYAEAEQAYRQALSIRLASAAGRRPEAAVTAHALARLLHKLKRYQESETLFQEAIEIRQKAAYPPLLATTYQSFAQLLRELNRSEEAAEYELRAREILETYSPTPHPTN